MVDHAVLGRVGCSHPTLPLTNLPEDAASDSRCMSGIQERVVEQATAVKWRTRVGQGLGGWEGLEMTVDEYVEARTNE